MPARDTPTIRADEIDATFVPHARSGIVFVELDDEMVIAALFDEGQSGQFDCHWLDRSATIIWKLFDGTATLGELAVDLGDAFGVDGDVMLTQVLDVARAMGRGGLLRGVAVERRLDIPDASTGGLPAGTELPPFRLLDLDGHVHTNDGFRGRRVLLVNWSPGCGFCASMAGDLADLVSGFAAVGGEVVLVTAGTDDDNRALADEAGLTCTLLRNDAYELFQGFGTPVAYLVDEHGKLASQLAVGAAQIIALGRRAIEAEDAATP
jgi:peroxiredoxin